MSDYIATLPVDDEPVTPDDRYLANTLFGNNKRSILGSLLRDLKQPLVAGVLFAILSNSTVTQLIRDVIPYAKSSEISLLIFKTSMFIILMYLYNNLHLVRT